eukprot:NODE_2_length_91304_cov_0.692462.p9 type:complete len:593 gc:universal NODE_2_length_91304_cov_0.692462:84607-86385(+)
MFTLFADIDDSLPSTSMTGYQIYFVEEFVCQQLQFKSILIYTGNNQDEVKLYQYPISNKVPHISNLPNIQMKKTEYGNLFYFEFHQVGLKIIHSQTFDLDLMHQHITLQKFGIIDKLPFALKPISESVVTKLNHMYKLQATTTNYKSFLHLMLQILSSAIKAFGISIPVCSFFSNSLLNSYQACLTLLNVPLTLIISPKYFSLIVSKVLGYRNKLNLLLKDVTKDPFIDIENLLKAISSFQKSKDLYRSGYLDIKTMKQIDLSYQKHKERHIPNKIKSKLEDLSGIQQKILFVSVDSIEELLEYQLGEKLGLLWSKEEKEVEGLLKGGKEFGKSLIKNVQSKTLISDGERVLSISHPLNPLSKKRKSSTKSSDIPESPRLQEPRRVAEIQTSNDQNHYEIYELSLLKMKAKSTENLVLVNKALRRTFSETDLQLLYAAKSESQDALLLNEVNDLFQVLNSKESALEDNLRSLQQLELELQTEKDALLKKCDSKKSIIDGYESVVNALLSTQNKISKNSEENGKRLNQAKKEMQQFEMQLSKVEDTISILSSKIADNAETEKKLIESAKPVSLISTIIKWSVNMFYNSQKSPK